MKVAKSLRQGRRLITCDLTKEEKSAKGVFSSINWDEYVISNCAAKDILDMCNASWIHFFGLRSQILLTSLGYIVAMSFFMNILLVILWYALRYFNILWSYFVKDEKLTPPAVKVFMEKKAPIKSSLRKKWRGFLVSLGILRKAAVSAFRLENFWFPGEEGERILWTVQRGGCDGWMRLKAGDQLHLRSGENVCQPFANISNLAYLGLFARRSFYHRSDRLQRTKLKDWVHFIHLWVIWTYITDFCMPLL